MNLKKNIQTILREESKILGLSKNVFSESKEKSLSSLEKSVEHFLNTSIEDYDLPENFHKMVVDIYYNRWGALECNVTILFKKSFNILDSDNMYKIVGDIRNDIREYFGDIFSSISIGGSTIDGYNQFKWWYDERKTRRVNESEENKKEKKFNRLIQNVEDYLNSNEYPRVNGFTVYYEDTHDDVIVNIFFDAEESVKLGGRINSVIKKVEKQVMSDLEIFPLDFKYYTHFHINDNVYSPEGLNESEEKQSKYLNVIKNLIEPFKEEDCVCDITISFENESYNIYLVFAQEELNDKFFSSNTRFNYKENLRKNVKNTIKDFLPIDNFYVGSISKPNCEWNPLNESEERKLSLLNKIKNVGLYQFTNDSGITYEQLKQKVGDIPRDIKIQFIKDYVINHSNPDGIYKGIDFSTDQAIKIRSTKDLVHLIEQIVVLPRTNKLEFDIWVYEVDAGFLGNSDWDSYTLTEEKATDDDLDAIINHFFKFS